MKLKEEILFEKYDQDENGKLKPLTDRKILEAMEEYADEKIRAFWMWKTGRQSRYEMDLLIKKYENEDNKS